MTETLLAVGLGFAVLLFVASLTVRVKVKEVAERLSAESSSAGMTGSQFVEEVIGAEGLSDLEVEGGGSLAGGGYLAGRGEIRVPEGDRGTLLALGVAAHEVAHAGQAEDHPLVAEIGGRLETAAAVVGACYPVLLVVGFLYYPPLVLAGFALFLLLLLLMALESWLELRASRTAIGYLRRYGALEGEKLRKLKKLLTWAILTRITYLTGGYLGLALTNEREVRE